MRRALTIGLMIVLGGTAAEAQDTADGSPLDARVARPRGSACASAAPTRRPQNRVPSAGIRSAAPRRPASAPSRAAANPNATRRTAEAATPSAASPRHTNSSGSTPRAATSRPGTSSRRAEQPANARPGTSRSASPRLATPSRPTLQRRPAATTTRGATSGRTNASRPNLRPSTSRGSAVSGWRTRVVAPSRPSGPPRAQPQTQQRRRGSAMPTRSAPSTRSRPTATRARPTTTRARPATSGARPTTSRPATRSAPARHPTVSARPKPPPRRGGRGG